MIGAATIVAGVVGQPVRHSLSPAIHNAWIAAAGLDAVYVAFAPPVDRFAAFAEGLRGGVVRGLNVTVPFKLEALDIAGDVTSRAASAGAANLLLFDRDGTIGADSTDGDGLIGALAEQAPGFDASAGPAVVFGAGGAGRSAVAALLAAGAPRVRLVNRSLDRALAVAEVFGGAVQPLGQADAVAALVGANLVVNATSLGLGGGEGPVTDFTAAPDTAVVMDMVYRPLRTGFLEAAARRGLRTVDGLSMLIAQARPSFAALFGQPAPDIDVRAVALALLAAAQ
jgi:shikimate dehydrogenase